MHAGGTAVPMRRNRITILSAKLKQGKEKPWTERESEIEKRND